MVIYNILNKYAFHKKTKSYCMSTPSQPGHMHPVLQLVRNFFNKLRQNPEIYPIKYYKKGQRYRRNWKSPMVK